MKRIFLLFTALACIVVCGGLKSCQKEDKGEKTSILEEKYFTVQNGTHHDGEIPFSTSGISIADDVSINRNALNGGSSYVSIAANQEISEVYVSVEGVDGYYSITPQAQQLQSSQEAALSAATSIINYSFIILYSQNLNDDLFNIQISARLQNGALTVVHTVRIRFIQAGTGSLQVSLSFENDKDVDLYVVCPDGEVVFYGNAGNYTEEAGIISGWGLDIDSNAGCDIDGINNENIFFGSDFIQSGKYEVWVNMYMNCNRSTSTNWIISALHEGALISTTSGRNPATGVFPVGTSSNSIGSSLTGATKVMEFTLSNNRSVRSGNAPVKKIQYPLSEPAKQKLINAGQLNDN